MKLKITTEVDLTTLPIDEKFIKDILEDARLYFTSRVLNVSSDPNINVTIKTNLIKFFSHGSETMEQLISNLKTELIR
jgi:hypothetical protein